MKTVVLEQDVLELEIKPHALISEYRELLALEVESRLIVPNELLECPCPGCSSRSNRVAFEKMGFTYRQCDKCTTVFVSPRPSGDALDNFYVNSGASEFWRERILPATKELRREKLFQPRARWLLNVIDQYLPKASLGLIVGYHNDLLLEELVRQESRLFQIIVTNPIAELEFDGLGFPEAILQPTPLGELSKLGPVDLILAFDVLDRSADLDELFTAMWETLRPGGLLLATTTLISGFDLQILWGESENIFPPERLNLLSVEGLTELYERHGFESLEFSTPGTFDVEVVQRAVLADPEREWPRFVRYLMENRDTNALDAFQEYLQAYRLSSFARVVLRKIAT